ncbi:MAG: type II 3-dehydroquinate dehydratase [Bacteroidia bacterium]|nr:type II 3-dehydroquinate dehydratase [Bacteroidia bacterium]
MRIEILNGPNLNLLGKREPGIYGDMDFESFLEGLREKYPAIQIGYFQSNVEGELINRLHEVGFSSDGIIFNAGGYTHTSVAIADAVAAISSPVIEVHISNVFAREEFRHHSLMAARCRGSVSGLGLRGYELALLYFAWK